MIETIFSLREMFVDQCSAFVPLRPEHLVCAEANMIAFRNVAASGHLNHDWVVVHTATDNYPQDGRMRLRRPNVLGLLKLGCLASVRNAAAQVGEACRGVLEEPVWLQADETGLSAFRALSCRVLSGSSHVVGLVVSAAEDALDQDVIGILTLESIAVSLACGEQQDFLRRQQDNPSSHCLRSPTANQAYAQTTSQPSCLVADGQLLEVDDYLSPQARNMCRQMSGETVDSPSSVVIPRQHSDCRRSPPASSDLMMRSVSDGAILRRLESHGALNSTSSDVAFGKTFSTSKMDSASRSQFTHQPSIESALIRRWRWRNQFRSSKSPSVASSPFTRSDGYNLVSTSE